MASRIGIPLVSTNKAVAEAVDRALGSDDDLVLAGVCSDLPQLAWQLQKEAHPVALVDVARGAAGILDELSHLVSRFPGTRFVVLGDGRQKDLILDAMQAGARYFLLTDAIEGSLAATLRKLLVNVSSPAASKRVGVVTTILSASGGCGATTVAVNIANELQLASASPSLLIDFDCAYGSLATHLGVSGEFGLADVLGRNGSIDSALIRSSTMAYSDGLHVLVSPASVNFAEPRPLEIDNLRSAIQACRLAYGFTVIDAPRVQMDLACQLAKLSDVTIVCFQLTVKDIRIVRDVFGVLAESGVPEDSVQLLANRYRKRSPMISLAEGKEALRGMDIECISNDYRSAIRGLNFGQPLAQAAPRSILRRDLRRLVARISRTRRPSPNGGQTDEH